MTWQVQLQLLYWLQIYFWVQEVFFVKNNNRFHTPPGLAPISIGHSF